MQIDRMSQTNLVVAPPYKNKETQVENPSELNETKFGQLLERKNVGKEKGSVSDHVLELLSDVEKTKVNLEQNMTMDTLKDYKGALQSFLDHYVNKEMRVDQSFVKDRKGYPQKIAIVRSINEDMKNMTENMLLTNRGQLQMLHKIGQIQGLIVNELM